MLLPRLLLLLRHTQLDTTRPQPLITLGLITLASFRQDQRTFNQGLVRSIHLPWQGFQALHGTVKALQVIPNLQQICMGPTWLLRHLTWVMHRMAWRMSRRCATIDIKTLTLPRIDPRLWAPDHDPQHPQHGLGQGHATHFQSMGPSRPFHLPPPFQGIDYHDQGITLPTPVAHQQEHVQDAAYHLGYAEPTASTHTPPMDTRGRPRTKDHRKGNN